MHAAIGVVDQSFLRPLLLDGHRQRRGCEFDLHIIPHGQPTIFRLKRSMTAARYSQPIAPNLIAREAECKGGRELLQDTQVGYRHERHAEELALEWCRRDPVDFRRSDRQ